jgi:hypothetical protein
MTNTRYTAPTEQRLGGFFLQDWLDSQNFFATAPTQSPLHDV